MTTGLWKNDAVAKRLLKEIGGLQGDDIEERKEAIVVTWLNTVQHQELGHLEEEIERLKKWLLFISAFELGEHGGHTGAAQAALDGKPAPTW